ncbi:hypothetical protein PFX98_12280 [Paucibacter sediminis]|uniref:Tetratricopeptide repeat protein n=1 Tax=Paucibacter sediminis TaxID=3019553 RepID=A0AA95NH63_9BURK|nr:hypothetical protein [Paucibacter sp. S2-9]WIT14364.1 hypothetical protein PFX98_12280 [Paucibacter sp. S2-9]
MRRLPSLLVLLLLFSLRGLASPYTPQADEEVLEQLPRRLAAVPRQGLALPQALGLAQAALQRARQEGDPRELGRAQALLAPWWHLPAPPPAVRLLRASMLQTQHRFDAALQDLDALLAGASTPLALRAQAELTRAALLQLRGRWPEARSACTRLAGLSYAALGAAVQVHGRVCLAELDSLQGRNESAAAALAQLARYPQAPTAWILLLRAELAERRGLAEAEALYRQALQAEPSIYTRAALADWLLARRRWAEAAALVLAHQSNQAEQAELVRLPDALLLRLAIAWRAGGDARASEAAAQLQERFEAAALRGDGSAHARERARYALDVRPDAGAALQQAIANWALQREPADAWLLWRAAQLPAAPKPLAAQARQAFEQFRRESGMQDARWSAAS